jgi:RNA-splicing ligase RtcB
LRDRYRAYIAPERFQGFADESPVGRELAKVIEIGSNVGYAYQVACFRAVTDALEEAAGQRGMPAPGLRMLCCLSHNHIRRESLANETSWIARHNAVRAVAEKPTLIAGRNDAESCLGIGMQGGARWLHSYGHGIGRELERAELRVGDSESAVTYQFARGREDGLLHQERRPLVSRAVLQQVLQALESERVTRPVAYLRPLGTMHN